MLNSWSCVSPFQNETVLKILGDENAERHILLTNLRILFLKRKLIEQKFFDKKYGDYISLEEEIFLNEIFSTLIKKDKQLIKLILMGVGDYEISSNNIDELLALYEAIINLVPKNNIMFCPKCNNYVIPYDKKLLPTSEYTFYARLGPVWFPVGSIDNDPYNGVSSQSMIGLSCPLCGNDNIINKKPDEEFIKINKRKAYCISCKEYVDISYEEKSIWSIPCPLCGRKGMTSFNPEEKR